MATKLFQPGNTKGFKKGFDPNRNVTKPGTGAPRLAFRDECSEFSQSEILARCKAYILTHDPSDRGFQWASDWISQYGVSKAPTLSQSDVTHRDAPPRMMALQRVK